MSSLTVETNNFTNENAFQRLTKQAVARQQRFGKVSGSTGWTSVSKWSSLSSVVGLAVNSKIRGTELKHSLYECYGSDVAQMIDRQLSLSKATNTQISVFTVAKAVEMVKELTFLHTVKMEVGGVTRSLDPNDPFYLIRKATIELDVLNELIKAKQTSTPVDNPTSTALSDQSTPVDNPTSTALSDLQQKVKAARKNAVALYSDKTAFAFIYSDKTAFTKAYNDALIRKLRSQDWPIITTTMIVDPEHSNQKTKTTITPAGQTVALKKKYENKGIKGIPSSDTSSKHAVGLRINKSDDCFVIVSSGLDPSVNKTCLQDEDIIKERFQERLLVNLETQGKLPKATPQYGEPGSATNPITILMTDFGLLSADISKEGKAQDKQFEFLDAYQQKPISSIGYDPKKPDRLTNLFNQNQPENIRIEMAPENSCIEVTYHNCQGEAITIHVQPTVRAFNFGAQWIDRSRMGGKFTWLKACCSFKKGYKRAVDWINKNEAAFNSLNGDVDNALNAIKTCVCYNQFSNRNQQTLLKTIYKNYTGGELDPNNINNEQVEELRKINNHIYTLRKEVKKARERLKDPDHYDYHDEALVLCLSSMIGAAPNIHCKSGKDRTSLLLSHSQWIMYEIKQHDSIIPVPDQYIPVPGQYTDQQRARLAKFIVGTGNGYWQFLNTLNVGNKQAAGWWRFRSNFLKTVTSTQRDIIAGNENESSA